MIKESWCFQFPEAVVTSTAKESLRSTECGSQQVLTVTECGSLLSFVFSTHMIWTLLL